MKLQKKALAIALGAALVTGIASQAMAGPLFTINPQALPGGTFSPFQADFITGSSSELAMFAGGNTTTGNGYISFGTFGKNGSNLDGFTTGLGNSSGADYGLFAQFQVAGTLSSGPGGSPPGNNSVFTLTSANFQVFADPAATNAFTPASPAGAGTPATVTDTSGDDIFLASGSLVAGTAGTNSLGGLFLNVIDTFDVCTGPGTASRGGMVVAQPLCITNTGSAFFAAPNPFYNLVFAEFNNTTGGATPTQTGGNVAINSASGGVAFGATSVPEPGSLALLGIALAGAGFASRRDKKAKV